MKTLLLSFAVLTMCACGGEDQPKRHPVPGNTPPKVVVTSPTEQTAYVGAPVLFAAHASDAEDGDNCCTLTWTSRLTGELFTTQGKDPQPVSFTFSTHGLHVITVIAVDRGGLESEPVSFNLDVKSTPPTVQINAPIEAETVYRGVSYQVKGSARDGLTVLPCEWSSDDLQAVFTPAQAAVGCAADVIFTQLGFRSVTLQATNIDGLTSTTTVRVTVVDPPQTSALVTITAPANNAIFYGMYEQTLTGFAQYGDGTAVPDGSLRWSQSINGPTVLGTGSSLVATFMQGQVTIILEALNENGAVVGSQYVIVTFNDTIH